MRISYNNKKKRVRIFRDSTLQFYVKIELQTWHFNIVFIFLFLVSGKNLDWKVNQLLT